MTEPDELGEYPVMVIDEDDVPYAAIMYPGFDVYMADLAGLLNLDFDTYESLHDDKRYQSRLRQHAARIFHGKPGAEMQDLEWYGEEGWPDEDGGDDDEEVDQPRGKSQPCREAIPQSRLALYLKIRKTQEKPTQAAQTVGIRGISP